MTVRGACWMITGGWAAGTVTVAGGGCCTYTVFCGWGVVTAAAGALDWAAGRAADCDPQPVTVTAAAALRAMPIKRTFIVHNLERVPNGLPASARFALRSAAEAALFACRGPGKSPNDTNAREILVRPGDDLSADQVNGTSRRTVPN